MQINIIKSDVEKIIKKYINYFESKNISKDDKQFSDFLNDTSGLFEKEYFISIDPQEILKQITHKFGIASNFLSNIPTIVQDKEISQLDTIELLTLLFFCSCRNIFMYDENYYLTMAQQGVIGKLLKELDIKHDIF